MRGPSLQSSELQRVDHVLPGRGHRNSKVDSTFSLLDHLNVSNNSAILTTSFFVQIPCRSLGWLLGLARCATFQDRNP